MPKSIITSRTHHHHTYSLNIPNQRMLKSYENTSLDRSCYAKPKSVVKLVKGLPHLCPCNQPTKMRISHVHEVNISRTQLLSMSHKKIQHNHTFCNIEYIYFHEVFYLFLSHLNLANLEKNWVTHTQFLPPSSPYSQPKSYLG